MTGIRQLHELQEIDTLVDARTRRMAQINRELQENRELAGAVAVLDAKKGRLRRIEEEQKSNEWDLDATRSRIASHEDRMYGNQAGNPKELQSIAAEIVRLRERQGATETRVLELMEQADAARLEVQAQQSVVGEVEAALRSTQSHLLEERARIEGELPHHGQRRAEVAASIPPQVLRMYEDLKAAKGGVAVARIDRGTCTGCRIAVPITLAQRARTGQGFTYCSSCSRLLYAT
ncbi:MAG: hypothetical protein HY680_10030 [Chloroflexi bacterium]|nr:hypothetical protein [Chloroflexota bacterium]